MGFGFTVVNLPPEAKYWAARFDIGGQNYWLGVLTEEGKFQTYPVAGFVDAFHVFLYDSNQNYLGPAYGLSLYYGITVTDGGQYQFDWSTNQFKGIEKPKFSFLSVSLVPDYIRPGDFFYVTITFDYSGPDIIGALAIEVAIGRKDLWVFNAVEAPLIKIINVYGPANSYQYTYTYQSLATLEPSYTKYDVRVAIGNYPWDGTIYISKTKAMSVLPPEAIPPVFTCPYCGDTFATKAELDAHIATEHPGEVPPEEVPAVANWLPWAIGGGAVALLAVVGVVAATRKG